MSNLSPLKAFTSGAMWHLLDEREYVIADLPMRAGDEMTAHRLAASWNACIGIPTEALESGRYVVVPMKTTHPSLLSAIAKRLRSDEERHRTALGDHIADAYGMVAEWVESVIARTPQEGGESE